MTVLIGGSEQMMIVEIDRGAGVRIEAEDRDLAISDSRTSWTLVADPRASEQAAMMFVGEASASDAASSTEEGSLSFSLSFAEAGTYHLQVRGRAEGNLADAGAIQLTLDGRIVAGGTGLAGVGLGYRWLTTDTLELVVGAPGQHQLNIRADVPGQVVDALYISSDRSDRPGEHQAVNAAEFLDSLGVNTHLGWLDTAYGDLERVRSALDYLGTGHIRDTIVQDWDGPRFDELAAAGQRLTLFISHYPYHDLAWQVRELAERASVLEMIEGPNESDYWPVDYAGLSGFEATKALMRDLRQLAEADPLLRDVGITQTTVGDVGRYRELGDLGAYADTATIHAYFTWGDPASWSLDQRIREAQLSTPGKGVVATEAGFLAGPDAVLGVSEQAQADYTLRMLFEAFSRGVERTFVYELLDAAPVDPRTGSSYGLFRNDGTPRPAATAIHNLTGLLQADDGAAGMPGTLDYVLHGMPASADDLLLQRGDGTFLLALWNDVRVWDSRLSAATDAPDASIRIDLPEGVEAVSMHDLVSGSVTALVPARQLALNLPPRVVVLEITMAGPAGDLLPAVLQTGADELVMKLSEDAWDGHAQYVIKVDGEQLGGVRTASASRSLGQMEEVMLTGSWNTGRHSVSVEFVNDAYAGTPQTDRNLYVHEISLNGEVLSDSSTILFGNWSKTVEVGADALTLRMSEDQWGDHARFTVLVDGVQQGGVHAVTALRAAQQTQDFTFRGDWGEGRHEVVVNFLNDAYAGTPQTDRNLYVEDILLNGEAVAGAGAALMSAGVRAFTLGETRLTLHLSEDEWGGHAQFILRVDGVQVGGVETVTAKRLEGRQQEFTFADGWGPGQHDVSVEFLNDAFQPGVGDRNLIVEGVSIDGAAQSGTGALLYAAGTVHFDLLF